MMPDHVQLQKHVFDEEGFMHMSLIFSNYFTYYPQIIEAGF